MSTGDVDALPRKPRPDTDGLAVGRNYERAYDMEQRELQRLKCVTCPPLAHLPCPLGWLTSASCDSIAAAAE